jgi:hypothetical protein
MRLAIALLVLMLLFGCSSPNIANYREGSPKLDIREYFNGDLDAWGIVKDRNGNVTRRFYATIKGRWNGAQGTLDEQFFWSDGQRESRIWTLTMHDDNHFSGSAHDVVGISVGEQQGNAVQMLYVLRVPRTGGETIDITMDDWMYRITDQEMINETTMRKLGIEVGSISIGFRKR